MAASTRELWLSFIAIVLITLFYLFIVILLGGIPAASEFFGHSLGILGFVLMLMTETLYSLRKRSRSARWGRMASWLQFHIFTGLVGPYLVLLHSSWKFNGLAGVVMLMTVVVVGSGFIGRYIYTAVPRTADGIALEGAEIERMIAATEVELKNWTAAHPEISPYLEGHFATGGSAGGGQPALILERSVRDWSRRLRWWWEKQRLEPAARAQVEQLQAFIERRRVLRRQAATLAQMRRLLALWHAVHIPIGMALFTAAFIHIGAAIYYATLLR